MQTNTPRVRLREASRSHIPALDGLRGLAVAAVMVAHLPAEAAAKLQRIFPQLMHMSGYLGVDLFFVLSGFLITRILLTDREQGTPLRFFLARRCLRIFPVYYLVLSIYALVSPSVELLWCAAYLSNFYYAFVSDHSLLRHTWSLCIEEHFYLFWPLLVHRLSARWSLRLLWVLLLVSLGSSLALVLQHVPHAASLIYQGTLSRMWSLAMGAWVAFAQRGHCRQPFVRAWPYLAIGGVVAACAAGLAVQGRAALAYLVMVPGYSLVSLGLLLLAVASGNEGSFGRVLNSAALRRTGRISYGLYLFHPFAYRLFLRPIGEEPSVGLVFRCLAGVETAFIAASLSFRFFESYFLRLKARFEPAARLVLAREGAAQRG